MIFRKRIVIIIFKKLRVRAAALRVLGIAYSRLWAPDSLLQRVNHQQRPEDKTVQRFSTKLLLDFCMW